MASLRDVQKKEETRNVEAEHEWNEASEVNQLAVEKLKKYRGEQQGLQNTLSDKQQQLQQTEDTKTLILKGIQQKQTACEEEVKELKTSIASLQENYRANLVAVARLRAETQTDQYQMEEKTKRVEELVEEEKRLMQLLQEKEAYNASRRNEVEQQKQSVLMAKQTLAEKNRRLVQLNEDLKEQEELYSSEKKLLLQRRTTQQVTVDLRDEQ